MSLAAAGALALAAALDDAVAEPPTRAHPVAWLGRVVAGLDDRLPDTRAAGVGLAASLPLAFAVLLAGPVLALGAVRLPLPLVGSAPVPSAVGAGVVLFVCSSRRMLLDVAGDVLALVGDDLPAARNELRALAGRDASELSADHVRSAVVESAAENLADGLVAPLLAFAAGATAGAAAGASVAAGLALAAGAAAWVKGVNTLDSMLGYRDRQIGWAPARLDDAVMWIPARAAALLVVASAPSRVSTDPRGAVRRLWAAARRLWAAARRPASPNSGWPMASLAAVLGVRLEKPGAYTLLPDRSLPAESEARTGVGVVSRAGWLGVGITGVSLAL